VVKVYCNVNSGEFAGSLDGQQFFIFGKKEEKEKAATTL
jgi:hypothetical protein